MKILLVAPTYLPSRRANTIQTMKMAQAAQILGHNVCVLVPDPGRGEVLDWDFIAYHYGLNQRFEVRWLPINTKLRGYDYGVKAIRFFQKWQNADILYTRLPQAAAFSSLLNIPTIFEIHDLPGGAVGPILFRGYLRGRGGKRVVFITKALRDAVNETIWPVPDQKESIIAPDGVDLSRYEDIRNPELSRVNLRRKGVNQLDISRFTIGYTGHMYPGRGVSLILEIASRLPQFSFLLVGGDPHGVRDIQVKLGERKLVNVFLTGFVPNTDLPEYQAACDVLLMPYQRMVSASSGGDIGRFLSPMKLFEYLACGRVIISSDLPVLSEVLNASNAILLPPEKPNLWVSALLDLKENHIRRETLSSNARRDSKAYSWESRAARIFSSET